MIFEDPLDIQKLGPFPVFGGGPDLTVLWVQSDPR